MGLYNVAGRAETHARVVNKTWESWLETGDNVTFISSEGKSLVFNRNIALLFSKMLTRIFADIPPTGSDICISLQLPEKLISSLLKILVGGKTTIANKKEVAEVKAAGKMLGIALDDLNLESSDTPFATKRIKKEIIDDELFPPHSEVMPKSKQKTKLTATTPRSAKSVNYSKKVGSVKKVVPVKASSKPVPAEMLLREDSTSRVLNIKKEVTDDAPKLKQMKDKKKLQVSFSSEFANFAHGASATPKVNNPIASSLKSKSLPLRIPSVAEIQKKSSNKKSSISKTLRTNRGSTVKKNNVEKKDVEVKFKNVEITDKTGHLVNTKKGAVDSSKKEMIKERVNSSEVKQEHKNKPTRELIGPKKSVSKKLEKNVKQLKKVVKQNKIQQNINNHKVIKTEKADYDDDKAVGGAEDDVAIEYEETEETKCPYCYKEFSEFKRLSSHMLAKHQNEV